MTRKVKTFEELKVGDIIELYLWTEGSYVIEKQMFRIVDGNHYHCPLSIIKVDKNNRTIYDWYGTETRYNIDNYTLKQNHFGHLYLDPKEIGAKAIEVARKKKAQINKRIMDIQRFMYGVK
jgi:hypothetical protein